jgi:hypothetical protein
MTTFREGDILKSDDLFILCLGYSDKGILSGYVLLDDGNCYRVGGIDDEWIASAFVLSSYREFLEVYTSKEREGAFLDN